MDNEVISQLEAYIASDILKQPGRHITPGEPIVSSGLVGSFNLVDVALFVEDTFGVHIDDVELNGAVFDTLEELAALIRERRSAP